MNFADKAAAWLVCVIGAAHLAVGYAVFIDPTERRVWFAAAGMLLIVTGLANLAAMRATSRMQCVAAAAGSFSMLIIGVLLALADPALLTQPQTPMVLALGLLLTFQRLRGLITAQAR